jgi:hypothetical protein
MTAWRINSIFLLGLTAVTLVWGRPSFSETAISEQTLASDIVIDKIYQPGSGLPVGKIQSVRGEAIVFHRNPAIGYRIQPGLPLYAGDVLYTRETAWILCRLVDGSHIVLTPKTTLTIHQSSYNSSRKMSVTALYLKHGSARFKLNPMPDLSSYDYKVRTEVALARARQADFVVQASPEATEIIAFENSRLEIASMAKPEEITFLSDFQRTMVSEAILSPTVETLSKEDIVIMQKGFHAALSGTLAADGTMDESPDPKTENTLIEEDIVED